MVLVKELVFTAGYENDQTKEFTTPVIEKSIYYEIPDYLTDSSYQITEGTSRFEISGVEFHPAKIKYNFSYEDDEDVRCISDDDAQFQLICFWKDKFQEAIKQVNPDPVKIQLLKETYNRYMELLKEMDQSSVKNLSYGKLE